MGPNLTPTMPVAQAPNVPTYNDATRIVLGDSGSIVAADPNLKGSGRCSYAVQPEKESILVYKFRSSAAVGLTKAT